MRTLLFGMSFFVIQVLGVHPQGSFDLTWGGTGMVFFVVGGMLCILQDVKEFTRN